MNLREHDQTFRYAGRSRLTYSLAATWSEPLSDAIPPPAAKVEQAPLDNDGRL